MYSNTPSFVWSIVFALLYLMQMYRFGRLSMYLRNPFAQKALTFWSVLFFIPLILVVLNHDKAPSLSTITLWVRGNILAVLTAIVIIGQVLISISKRFHIGALKTDLKEERDPEKRYRMAALLEQYGLYEEAIVAHRITIETSPNLCKPYVNLAALLGTRKQFHEAEKLCRQAILIDCNYGNAYFFLAKALMEQGQTDDARKGFKTALSLGIPGSLKVQAEQVVGKELNK